MVKKEGLRRGINLIVFLVLLSLILFAVFSFVTIRTNVNIINLALNALKGLVGDGNIESIQTNLNEIYTIIILETFVLGGAVVASLFSIIYLIKIYFQVRKKSLVDPLTELYNKRALYQILDTEVARAKRFKHPLTIAILDIDFFKVYNDKNGHLEGDVLLKRLSNILRRKIRDVDTVARYGGEEFVIIMPETEHEGAVRVAERIRKTVQDTHFKGESKMPKRRVTISLGLATFHGEYLSKKQMLTSADKLLYVAKEKGRNMLEKAYFRK